MPLFVPFTVSPAPHANSAPYSAILAERAVVTHTGELSGSTGGAAGGAARGTPWTAGGLVARSTGRVFFTLDGIEYACSAAVVAGVRADVVVTAAHCVSDGSGGWAQNWTFIPGYNSGKAPYGRYLAKTFYVSGRWANGSDEDDDVAFVVVRPAPGMPPRDVADITGSQPIVFGYRSTRADVFGYPAEAPYNGARLDYCSGKVVPDPYGAADTGVRCTMTEGDSGGPWLSDFDGTTGTGFITGVTSFKYAGAQRVVYSANLGSVAESLYTRAERPLTRHARHRNPPRPASP
jgi:V8-like Glu-specific endopeptidase